MCTIAPQYMPNGQNEQANAHFSVFQAYKNLERELKENFKDGLNIGSR